MTVQRRGEPSEDDKMDAEQLTRLQSFLDLKQKMGEIHADELEKLRELGVGSGGVVLKVRHRPSGLIMARKVSCFSD